MSLAVVPLVITGQITGVSNDGNATLYRMTFKNIDGDPLYGVTAVWTDEQAEIEALATQKPYGVWINPINGTFTVKFAGYTYVGTADLTDPRVLGGVTKIEFNNTSGGGGESDFTTCTVTFAEQYDETWLIHVPFVSAGETAVTEIFLPGGQTAIIQCILYKGTAEGAFADDNIPSSELITTTGGVSYDANTSVITVTGDGSLTIG